MLHSHWIKAWERFHATWIALNARHWFAPCTSNSTTCKFDKDYIFILHSLDVVFCCFIDTNELKHKFLKYYAVVKLSRHKVPTNRVSVALWRRLKWLLFTRLTFLSSIQWKWSWVQEQILKTCDVTDIRMWPGVNCRSSLGSSVYPSSRYEC